MEVHKKVVYIRLSLSCNKPQGKEAVLVNTVIPPEITRTVCIQMEVKRRGMGFQCDTTHGTHLQHWSVTLYSLTHTRLTHNGLSSQTESPHGKTYRKKLISS